MSSQKSNTFTYANSSIDLNTMRTFVAIADAGSFVAGGKLMGLTRSAAGKSLARLESHLGTRLLHRTTRTLSLTADGQYFYERCIQILTDLDEAESSIRQENFEPKGALRLTVTAAFGRIVVLPLLNEFLKQWPNLEVEISFTDRVVDLVEEGFDLGIRMGEMPEHSLMIARPIAKYVPYIYASPAYLIDYPIPDNIEALGDYQRLVYGLQASSGTWLLRNKDGIETSITGNRRLRFDSGEAIKDAAVEGMGLAFLPSFLADADVQINRLVKLFPMYSGKEIPINAIYPNRKHLSAKVRRFIDMLVSNLSETK